MLSLIDSITGTHAQETINAAGKSLPVNRHQPGQLALEPHVDPLARHLAGALDRRCVARGLALSRLVIEIHLTLGHGHFFAARIVDAQAKFRTEVHDFPLGSQDREASGALAHMGAVYFPE